MKKIANIGSLLKKIYRLYSVELIKELQARGFNDLRASFLEILQFLPENKAISTKPFGHSCGLKNQPIPLHLTDLKNRAYSGQVSPNTENGNQLFYLPITVRSSNSIFSK